MKRFPTGGLWSFSIKAFQSFRGSFHFMQAGILFFSLIKMFQGQTKEKKDKYSLIFLQCF
jgi:hypothetical protein